MAHPIVNIIKGKCPECGNGQVFETKGNPALLKMPKMHEHCSHCRFRFEKEPGYFIGAMYVSYALTLVEMIAIFILFYFIPGVNLNHFIYIMIPVLLLLSMFNFRMARMIWMYII
ncbi:DUF983 domain-containing protein [Fulvivirga ulvae]|uniref:DUF983 domain-containing protein n=1 Tax=Fulvivirga ulvae TaxID=2904245 RepID=UPI001F2919F5|nr:DUF983 domain-containing protein [Fulvivirga ulvae]UII33144.1 DUF983 domain-containing protein [Fulvivirga ulvae]